MDCRGWNGYQRMVQSMAIVIGSTSPDRTPNRNTIHLKVSALILQGTCSWDVEKLRKNLPQYEDQIRQIYLSSFKLKDALIWLPDKSGKYSSKTGYTHNAVHSKPALVDDFNWYENIWNVQTAPKIQTFLWKLKNRALPIGNNLAIRGITTDLRCKRCGGHEDELHILINCPFAGRVWELVPSIFKPQQGSITSLSFLLSGSRRMINLPPSGIVVALYPWIYWQLWKARSSLIFENKEFSEKEVCLKSLSNAQDWQAAQQRTKTVSQASGRTQLVRPSLKITNCFVDAAWNSDTLDGGLGWIFINHSKITLSQGSATIQFAPSALVAEALALKAAITAASTSEIRELNMFSDSQSFVMLLNAGSEINELKRIFFFYSF